MVMTDFINERNAAELLGTTINVLRSMTKAGILNPARIFSGRDLILTDTDLMTAEIALKVKEKEIARYGGSPKWADLGQEIRRQCQKRQKELLER